MTKHTTYSGGVDDTSSLSHSISSYDPADYQGGLFESISSLKEGHRKPVLIGMVITALWMSFGIFYISQGIGWQRFWDLPVESIGNFLEGAFAPMLFLWIVVGYYSQQGDILQNSRNLERQAQYIQLDTFMKVSELVLHHLSTITGQLYIASQGPGGSGRETEESMFKLWSAFQQDNKIFIRKLFELASFTNENGQNELWPELFVGTKVRRALSEKYIAAFDKLIHDAELCSPDNLVRDAIIDGTGQGLFYQSLKRMFVRLEDNPPMNATDTRVSPVNSEQAVAV